MNGLIFEKLVIRHEALTVLDVGCGTGAAMLDLSKSCPSCKLFGVNSDAAQIERAKQTLKDSFLDGQLTFYHSDFHHIPLPDERLDRVFAIESCCYSSGSDKSRFFQECARLLRKGGRIVVADGFLRHGRPLPPSINRLYRSFLRLWGVEQFGVIEDVVLALKRCSFEDVEVMDISVRTGFSIFHIPSVLCRLWLQEWKSGKEDKLWAHRSRYAKALVATVLMSLAFRHVGYFIISANRS